MHRKHVARFKPVFEGVDHHALHAAAMRIAAERRHRLLPAKAAPSSASTQARNGMPVDGHMDEDIHRSVVGQ